MAARKTFKEPLDTVAAEDWIRRREAIRLPRNYRFRHTLKCDGRRWGPNTSRTDVTHALVDGVEYPLKYAVQLRNDVQYVVDVVEGIAEFNVDVAIDANWNEPAAAWKDHLIKNRRTTQRP